MEVMTPPSWTCSPCTREYAEKLRGMALAALPRMYRPDEHLFGWCIRRGPNGDVLEGLSRRYTAMVLIGAAAQEDESAAASIFPDGNVNACLDRLLDDVDRAANVGDVALTLWAANAWRRDDANRALARLRSLSPGTCGLPTVELAWVLTACCVGPEFSTDEDLARAVARRLLRSFNPQSELFPHWPVDAPSPWLRRHVTCFADWVYPVQALSWYYRLTGDEAAIDAARRAAARMCGLQGDAGQWWWHFDVRTGQVIERYPVYAVHQDAMAPMALLDLQETCGETGSGVAAVFDSAVSRGLDWLRRSPERDDSLVDDQAGLIWRKVCRREPGKLTRTLQAAASRVHPALRMPLADGLLPPTRVDYECRPYHLGWILYAFSDRRLAACGPRLATECATAL